MSSEIGTFRLEQSSHESRSIIAVAGLKSRKFEFGCHATLESWAIFRAELIASFHRIVPCGWISLQWSAISLQIPAPCFFHGALYPCSSQHWVQTESILLVKVFGHQQGVWSLFKALIRSVLVHLKSVSTSTRGKCYFMALLQHENFCSGY